MISLKVEITGINEWVQKLQNASKGLADLTPEYEKIGNYLIPFFENEVFESEGAAIGQRWAPLSPKYEAWKTAHYPGRGTLERTSTLRYNFQAIPTSQYLILQNNTPYAGYVQYGTSRMPARIFLALNDQATAVIRQMLIDSLSARL